MNTMSNEETRQSDEIKPTTVLQGVDYFDVDAAREYYSRRLGYQRPVSRTALNNAVNNYNEAHPDDPIKRAHVGIYRNKTYYSRQDLEKLMQVRFD